MEYDSPCAWGVDSPRVFLVIEKMDSGWMEHDRPCEWGMDGKDGFRMIGGVDSG